MIITIEKDSSPEGRLHPFTVTCGYSKTEHRHLDDLLQQIAFMANDDREVTPIVEVKWEPAPV